MKKRKIRSGRARTAPQEPGLQDVVQARTGLTINALPGEAAAIDGAENSQK